MADFLANDAYHYTPASSPPSSPVHWDNLSSDATDPDSDNENEQNDTGSPWKLTSDPYSANAKATQSPLIHDRARQSHATPLTPASSFASYAPDSPTPASKIKQARSHALLPVSHDQQVFSTTPEFTPTKHTPIQDPVWEDALDDVFKNGASIVDLDNSNITSIPRAIIDLNSMVPLPAESEHRLAPIATPETPTRSAIASAAARSRRVFSQTRSNNTLFSGSPAGKDSGRRDRELQIYLANNNLTVLPTELFALKGLVLLSLRANNLRELPPVVGALNALRSLNVANNKLAYLPAELSSLTLQTLLVDPNPFLPLPEQIPFSTRILGPIKAPRRIPKLSELTLRVVLEQPPKLPTLSFPSAITPTKTALPTPSPSHNSVFSDPAIPLLPSRRFPPHPLFISSHYDIPSWLPALHPTSSRRIRAALHGSEDANDVYSFCPNSRHRSHLGEGEGLDNGLFVEPTENRFEWVKSLAGCELAGAVPILWRGCRAGCLDFLNVQETALNEQDEDEEFIAMFGVSEEMRDETMTEERREETIVEQIVWDEMDLDD